MFDDRKRFCKVEKRMAMRRMVKGLFEGVRAFLGSKVNAGQYLDFENENPNGVVHSGSV